MYSNIKTLIVISNNMTINKKSNKSIVSYGISATITLSLATILYDDLFDFILYS